MCTQDTLEQIQPFLLCYFTAPTVKPHAKSPIVIYRGSVTEIVSGNARDVDGVIVSNVGVLIRSVSP